MFELLAGYPAGVVYLRLEAKQIQKGQEAEKEPEQADTEKNRYSCGVGESRWIRDLGMVSQESQLQQRWRRLRNETRSWI